MGAQDATQLAGVLDLGRHHRLRAAVAQQQPVADTKLAAARVAAEVVVIVEDQDARPRPPLAIGPGRREPRQPRADNDQIIGFLGFHLVDVVPPALAGHAVDDGVGIVGGTPQPGERRRIEAAWQCPDLGLELLERGEGRGGGEGHTVEEIPARDLVAHAQVPL